MNSTPRLVRIEADGLKRVEAESHNLNRVGSVSALAYGRPIKQTHSRYEISSNFSLK